MNCKHNCRFICSGSKTWEECTSVLGGMRAPTSLIFGFSEYHVNIV